MPRLVTVYSNGKDGATDLNRMPSFEAGRRNSLLALVTGSPATMITGGDGNYVIGLGRKYGLPVRLGGDNNPPLSYFDGHNSAISEYVAASGLPWNSRLPFLYIAEDLEGYFRSNEADSIRVTANGVSRSIWNCIVSLRLEPNLLAISFDERVSGDRGKPHIEPLTKKVFASNPCSFDGDWIIPPVNSNNPLSYRPGEWSIVPGIFRGPKLVQCLPGPLNSHLFIFRFSDFAPHEYSRPPPTGENFLLLDTQLWLWIPGRIVEYF
jgi:hypothetical protein